jgi:hypothetical protein
VVHTDFERGLVIHTSVLFTWDGMNLKGKNIRSHCFWIQ